MIQPNKQENGGVPKMISSSTGVSLKLVVSLVLTALLIGGGYAGIWWKLDRIERFVSKQIGINEKILALQDKNQLDHWSLRSKIAGVHTEMLKNTSDRWMKANDLVFMRSFAEVNKLKMVPHERLFGVFSLTGDLE